MRDKKRPVFDPRIFISHPYLTCPKCHKEDSFGILMVGGVYYSRRCRECWFTESYKLPPLKKKIIYLDQFVVSEMMKAVNDKLGKKEKVDKFFFTLFEKLEELTKAQLIICPDSSFHKNESLLSNYSALKQMYEHFSHGISFFDPQTIHRFQITSQFKASLENKECVFDKTGGIMDGDLDGWQPKFRISVDFKITDQEVQEIRNSKLKTHDAIAGVFKRWQTEKNKKFKDWFIEEGLAFGKTMVSQYLESIKKHYLYSIGQLNLTAEEALSTVMGEPNTLVTHMNMYVRSDNIEEKIKKVFLFLSSEEMLKVPFNKLSALLWAYVAHSAAHGGQKTPPNKGMVNDIDMVSTLLPYCDAIFVDKPMFSALNHGDIKKEIHKYGTKIFSKTNKGEFLKYLDNIKKEAGENHLKKVVEVYGNDWAKPYWTMYKS